MNERLFISVPLFLLSLVVGREVRDLPCVYAQLIPLLFDFFGHMVSPVVNATRVFKFWILQLG